MLAMLCSDAGRSGLLDGCGNLDFDARLQMHDLLHFVLHQLEGTAIGEAADGPGSKRGEWRRPSFRARCEEMLHDAPPDDSDPRLGSGSWSRRTLIYRDVHDLPL